MLAKMLQQALPHMRGPQATASFPLQGGHRLPFFAPPADQAERLQVWVDIEREAVIGNPVVDGNTDAGNRSGADPDARTIPVRLTTNVKVSEKCLNYFTEAIDVGLQPHPE